MYPMEKHVYRTVLLTLGVLFCTAQDLREPPSIQEPPAYRIPDQYIRRGGTFQLPCEATGMPQPTYTWLHKSRGLDINKKSIRRLGMGTIEITDFQVTDQGEYQCVAANKYGKSLSQVFKVMPAILEDSGEVKVLTYSGKLGKPLVLPKTRFYVLPESGHIWKTVRQIDDPRPRVLQHNRRIVQDLEGNLYFTALREGDALKNGRFYKIEVYNEALRSAIGGSYSRVAVDTSQTPMDQPPALLYPKSSKRKFDVLEGTEMKIQCIFSGYPDVNVTWRGPAKILARPEESGMRLVLRKMTKEAAGEHECTGTNRAGSDRKKITVVMTTTPKFTEGGRPSKQVLTEGETATFRCQTTEDTNPQATVEWMINGDLVKDHFPGDRTEVTTIQNGKNLTIIKLNRDEDIKVIQCKASNMYKTRYFNAPLIVLKRTKLIQKPENQQIYSNTSQVPLICRATSDPSTTITVKWERAGQTLSDYADPRMKQDKNTGTLTLNLDGLVGDEKATYSGEYMCTATNGYSTDAHTAVVKYIKIIKVVSCRLWQVAGIFAGFLPPLIVVCICKMRNNNDRKPLI